MRRYSKRHRNSAAENRSQKGMVLIIVMSFVMLMALSMISFTSVMRRDVDLIGRVKGLEQARNIAEAGLSHAMVLVKYDVEDVGDLSPINGTLDTGTYVVTFEDPVEVDGTSEMKYRVVSTGTVAGLGVSKMIYGEIRIPIPGSLRGYHMEASRIGFYGRTGWPEGAGATIIIRGNIHANSEIYMYQSQSKGYASFMSVNDVDGGNTAIVSGREYIREGRNLYEDDPSPPPWYLDDKDAGIFINGLNNDAAEVFVGQDAPQIQFPAVNWGQYRFAAQNGGLYYSGDQIFTNKTLSPANGIVFVDGEVVFRGDCALKGGIAATGRILVEQSASLIQQDTAYNRNVVMSKTQGIEVEGRFGNVTFEDIADGSTGDEALFVYGAYIFFYGDNFAVQGSLVARGLLDTGWTDPGGMAYAYKYAHPEDVTLYPTVMPGEQE